MALHNARKIHHTKNQRLTDAPCPESPKYAYGMLKMGQGVIAVGRTRCQNTGRGGKLNHSNRSLWTGVPGRSGGVGQES
jgi:hypothetical protein